MASGCKLKMQECPPERGCDDYRECGKVCNEGQEYCPRHALMVAMWGVEGAEDYEQQREVAHAQ